MAVLKEYRCEKHGIFESRFPVCPKGCVEVERIFTQAPGLVSKRTRNIDATLQGIAKDHKLSDLSNKNGTLASSVDHYQPKATPPMDSSLQQAIDARMMQLGARFGSNFRRDSNGSFWRDNTNLTGPRASVTGHMDEIAGLPNKVEVQTVIQGAYGKREDVVAAATK
jgi:hypothetical protein